MVKQNQMKSNLGDMYKRIKTKIVEFHADLDPYNVDLFLLFVCKQSKVHESMILKVKNILKGSLDSIPSPSPSVKIQIMCGKVCLRCKGKTLLGIANKI